MKSLLVCLLLFPSIVLAEKACISVFEPEPCVGIKPFYLHRGGVLIPSRFGFFDVVRDEYGNVLTFQWGVLKGEKSYFFYRGEKRKPKVLLAESPDNVCIFERK